MSRRRPMIQSPCVADRYTDKTKERIAEFAGTDGESGGLLNLVQRDDGLHLSVYRTDGTVVHCDAAIMAPQTLRAAAKLYAEQHPYTAEQYAKDGMALLDAEARAEHPEA